MKIVFLDFDGTLGVTGFTDLSLQVELARILEETGAQLVLSTAWAWKSSEDPDLCFRNATAPITTLVKFLHPDWRCARFKESLAVDAGTTARRLEVAEWLGRHQDVTHWVAFDDAPVDLPGGILCAGGLTFEHLVKATELLTGPPMPALPLVAVDYGSFPAEPDLIWTYLRLPPG